MQITRGGVIEADGLKPLRHALFAQPAELTQAAALSVSQIRDHTGSQRRGRHFGIAEGNNHPQPHRPQRLAQVGQQPQRRLIRTVQVIDHHDLRGGRGRIPQRLPDPFEKLEPGSRPIRRPRGNHLRAEPAQHLHPRPQRRRPFALPARTPRHHRAACPPGSLPGQPGLTDTRLPAQQHHTAGSPGRLGGQRIENGKLSVPANQHARCRQPPHGDIVSPNPWNDRHGQSRPTDARIG